MAKRPGEPVLELERASFVGSRGDAAILKEAGLPPSGLRVLRYSAAKLRRSAGESIEDLSRFLDHSSLAVASTYRAA